MKKAKVMLLSIGIFAVMAGALAFKTKSKVINPTLYTATTTGVTGAAVTSFTTAVVGQPQTTVYTTTISTATVNPVKVTLYTNGL